MVIFHFLLWQPADIRIFRTPGKDVLPLLRKAGPPAGAAPFPGCFRQYPFVCPVFPAHIRQTI